ncbi:phytanoyl-CoA dioxygenase family protein [Chamaesiphon sp. VAR_48_metabat_135_sub]|uniref:phytanoyl-CoA dioxygenase family protein n=1 Tax=Chamaesiphon sp. VAR_48_metabat_135_sub TaxID=2964699 RepID=UPI00286C0750|nr:phytanoyl-CoA dioxygenase family protein [Chamaesiphon sp. VAR_48_metabat_135_sub]
MTIFTGEIEENGFVTIDRYLSLDSIESLIADITDLNITPGRAGIRNLLELAPSIRVLARSQEIRSLIEPILGDTTRVVRGIFFDKQPSANWKVPWHQDRTIAIKNRLDVPSYHSWSVKAGILHVQPPTAILERMLTVRIHLDKTDESNGALKVIPGSHCHGKLTDAEIDRWKQTSPGITCNCDPGGILLMRPLLLHASSTAIVPSHRRVIHLEYTSCELPSGLEWYSY